MIAAVLSVMLKAPPCAMAVAVVAVFKFLFHHVELVVKEAPKQMERKSQLHCQVQQTHLVYHLLNKL